jgi:hypothetical protein
VPDRWWIITREFRENMEWAVAVPGSSKASSGNPIVRRVAGRRNRYQTLFRLAAFMVNAAAKSPAQSF